MNVEGKQRRGRPGKDFDYSGFDSWRIMFDEGFMFSVGYQVNTPTSKLKQKYRTHHKDDPYLLGRHAGYDWFPDAVQTLSQAELYMEGSEVTDKELDVYYKKLEAESA